jgi:hypothetical protein
MSGLTHAIFRGWKVASMMSKVELLGAGRIVDANVPVRVAGKREVDSLAGNPFLVWGPVSLISDDQKRIDPSKNLVLWQSVNNENLVSMKTLGLFGEVENKVLGKGDDSEDVAVDIPQDEKDLTPLEFAFIACALRMFWGYRLDLAQQTAPACKHFAMLAKVESCDAIWGRGAWKTLPVAPPRDIRTIGCDGHKIGKLIRDWHDAIFSKFRMVEAWPIVAGPKESVPFQSAIDRGSEIRTQIKAKRDSVVTNGNDQWKNLNDEDLGRLVWTYPRQQLATLLGVTDMAISKRCKKQLVPQPPRGFWQKVKSCTPQEMAMFLGSHGVTPPDWWNLSFSKQRVDELESIEGVTSLVAKRECIDS